MHIDIIAKWLVELISNNIQDCNICDVPHILDYDIKRTGHVESVARIDSNVTVVLRGGEQYEISVRLMGGK